MYQILKLTKHKLNKFTKKKNTVKEFTRLTNNTGPQKKKVKRTLHMSILSWTPQFSPSLGEKHEILEISVSVKAVSIYAILK